MAQEHERVDREGPELAETIHQDRTAQPKTVGPTPGPWGVVPFSEPERCIPSVHSCGELPREICVLYSGGVDSPAECEANARLIAAAPELLAACRTLADYFACHDPNDCPAECGSGVKLALIQARAAIARAEGGAA